MTPSKVMEYVDGIRPNAYDEEVKLKWISDLDGMVRRLVFQEKVAEPYVYPDDIDKELLIPTPFDNVYALYLESMIDYYNREYGNYNNSAAMFEARFSEFKKAYIRGEIERIYYEESVKPGKPPEPNLPELAPDDGYAEE